MLQKTKKQMTFVILSICLLCSFAPDIKAQDRDSIFTNHDWKIVASIEDGCLPLIETDTTLIELKIFSSGQGYIKLGNKKGKVFRLQMNVNIETNLVGGEDFGINYTTDYYAWGHYPMRLLIWEPQDNKKDVTEKFIKSKQTQIPFTTE